MTSEAAPQTPAVPVGCMDGPMGGQTLTIGTTHVFVAQTLALWIIDNNIAFATAQGHAIFIDGQPQTRGYLQIGQRFFFNGSNWQVGVVAPQQLPSQQFAPQQADRRSFRRSNRPRRSKPHPSRPPRRWTMSPAT